MVEIDRFPTVVVHGTRAIGVGPFDNPVAQMPLERHRTAIQPRVRKHSVKRPGFKTRAGRELRAHRMAELNLTATVRQFLGDHAMTTGPTVVDRIGIALGVGRTTFRQQNGGIVFMPCAACPIVPHTNPGCPRHAVGLKLVDPATGVIDHLVRQLRRRQNRRGKVLNAYRRFGVDRGAGCDHPRFRIKGEKRLIGQTMVRVRVGKRNMVMICLNTRQRKARIKWRSISLGNHQPRLSGETLRRLGTNRQIRDGVQHATTNI